LVVLVAVLGALALGSRAQESSPDEDDGDGENARTASLSLSFDAHGAGDVSLDLDRPPGSWDRLRLDLSQALHCPAAQFPQNSQNHEFDEKYSARLSPKQSVAYRQRMLEFNNRRLHVRCESVLASSHAIVQGQIAVSPLYEALRQLGFQQLMLTINLPVADFVEAGPENRVKDPSQGSSSYLTYRIPINESEAPNPIRLSYGFRRADLIRPFAVFIGFVLVPVGLMLWMRKAALGSGKDDPTAAWFSYFRALNYCGNGAILLWVTSGLGARQSFENWVSFLIATGWKSTVAGILILLGPAWFVYFLCIAVSYPVFVQLRNHKSTRREFLLQQLLTVGAQALPVMFVLASIELMNMRLAVILLAAAYASRVLCVSLRVRISGVLPQPLTTGELRDRVFALANRAGVKIQQLLVMPAGKGEVANAFASNKNFVIFTDYLLERLSKREVDAIAGHELTHLRHRHPLKLQFALWTAVFAPRWFPLISNMLLGLLMTPLALLRISHQGLFLSRAYLALGQFERWSLYDLLMILVGLAGFYFLSRRFEHAADAGAVGLCGNPEDMITALLKVSRLNLMPIQWGKATGTWLTHPSTLHRVQRIADESGMSSERLHEILDRHSSEERAARNHGTAGIPDPVRPGEHYSVPPVRDPERLRSASSRLWSTRRRLIMLIAFHTVPPALVAWIIGARQWHGTFRLCAYLLGLVLTILITSFGGLWLGLKNRSAEKRRSLDAFRRQGLAVGSADDVYVGFAPGPQPRFYGATQYNWDSGFLSFASDRLIFVGEHSRFSLSRDQIVRLTLGQGPPSWWNLKRVYVCWKDAASLPEAVFSLGALEPSSLTKIHDPILGLHQRLIKWQSQTANPAFHQDSSHPDLSKIGEVTNLSPRELGKFRRFSKVACTSLLPVALALCILLRIDAMGYVCSVTVLAQLFGLIPYWRYRERPISRTLTSLQPSPQAAKAQAATTSPT
jgi:Zn-dependent protease with chaperone function